MRPLAQTSLSSQYLTASVDLMLDTLDIARLSGPDTSNSSTASIGSLYVVGGRQRSLRPVRAHFGDWYEYESGVLLHIDTASGAARQVVEYRTPAAECPPEEPAILFKSGTLVDGAMYLTTQTEVLVYQVPSFELTHRISLASFNDVHHVRPTADGTLLVAVTGLDMVSEVTLGGEVVREWNVWQPGAPIWGDRFSKDIDYRLVPTTKPHLAHPNHVFLVGDEPWATRFQQKDAVSLRDPRGASTSGSSASTTASCTATGCCSPRSMPRSSSRTLGRSR